MFEYFDKHVSVFTESLARKLSRRKMVDRTVKGAFAAVAAVTIGQLTGIGDALASTSCTCDEGWTTGHSCTHNGYPCPDHGCPTGCVKCYYPECDGWCNWSSSKWVSCTGLGTCGKGYKVCRDCKCPDCSNHCSCLSHTICRTCCTPSDVHAEMERLAAIGV
jgi:hypothetical protein